MAIRVQPKGYGAAVAELGKLVGEAKAAQTKQERADRLTERAMELKQRAYERREELAFRESQFQEELQLNKQRRADDLKFRREVATLEHQWDLEAWNRAKAWEIEKAELTSRADFAREEEKRQKEISELETKRKAIRDSAILSEDEKNKWLLQLETGLPVATRRGTAESPLGQLLAGRMGAAPVERPERRARVWSAEMESTPPDWVGATVVGGIPSELRPIETAANLLGQLETVKRTKAATGQVIRQKPIIEKRLVDEANKAAGFQMVTTQEPTYGEFGGRSRYTQPVTRWPDEALHIGDIYKLYTLNDEEIATAKAAFASGDPRVIRELIKNIKAI